MGGSYIIGFITVASGQGGIVFVWNVANQKIEHITEGAYTISALLHGNMVYNLCYVTNYTTPAHFMLCKAKFGTMDVNTAVEVVEFNCSCSIEAYNSEFNSIKLLAEEEELYLSADGKKYPIHIEQLR